MARQLRIFGSSTSSQFFWLAFVFVTLIVLFITYQFLVISNFSSRTDQTISHAFRMDIYNEELGHNMAFLESTEKWEERRIYRRNIEAILRKMKTLQGFTWSSSMRGFEESELLGLKVREAIDEIQISMQVYFQSKKLDYLIEAGKDPILQQIDLERKRLSGYLHESQLLVINEHRSEIESLRRLFQFSAIAILLILLVIFFFITRPALRAISSLRRELMETRDKLDRKNDEVNRLRKDIDASLKEQKKQKAAIDKMKETTFLSVQQLEDSKAQLRELLLNTLSRLKTQVKIVQSRFFSYQLESNEEVDFSSFKILLSDLNQNINELLRTSDLDDYPSENTAIDLGRLVSETINSLDKAERIIIHGNLPSIYGNEYKVRLIVNLFVEFLEAENQEVIELSSEVNSHRAKLKFDGIPNHKLRILDKLEFLDEDGKSDHLDELLVAREVLLNSGGRMSVETNGQDKLQFVIELANTKKAR